MQINAVDTVVSDRLRQSCSQSFTPSPTADARQRENTFACNGQSRWVPEPRKTRDRGPLIRQGCAMSNANYLASKMTSTCAVTMRRSMVNG